MISLAGEKLRDLLKQHGDFATMELKAKKYHKTMFGKAKTGGWFTRHYLATVGHYTKS